MPDDDTNHPTPRPPTEQEIADALADVLAVGAEYPTTATDQEIADALADVFTADRINARNQRAQDDARELRARVTAEHRARRARAAALVLTPDEMWGILAFLSAWTPMGFDLALDETEAARVRCAEVAKIDESGCWVTE